MGVTAAAYPVATAIIGGGAAGYAISEATKPKPAELPTILPPAVMPTLDDESVKKARKRSLLLQQQRSGRVSTIMSQGDEDTLG